mmetsp:Transcript_15092/g.19732  ORF Transcript_15092/g.19732 Transcript_15092/m.19732 type:complete len:417 (+) Transcript_15092:102-1352(+)
MLAVTSKRILIVWAAAIALVVGNVMMMKLTVKASSSSSSSSPLKDANYLAVWIVAQWIPIPEMRRALLNEAWGYWEGVYGGRMGLSTDNLQLEIPTVDVQDHINSNKDGGDNSLLEFLEVQFGKDWRKRPLLLRNLWTLSDLQDPQRRLSVNGLLKENLTIPYFTDARKDNALSPDASAPIGSIVSNMTHMKSPHKIGTQLLVQRYPELVNEIAPTTNVLTQLFGDHFTPDHVRGMGPDHQWLPALTTVPVFIASSTSIQQQQAETEDSSQKKQESSRPYTALHCEPIGNVAVQLSGSKQWKMVDPVYSFLIRPSTAPDGRAFFASSKAIDEIQVPTYSAVTSAGDAMWIPTWTWHRVDYTTTTSESSSTSANNDIAIGGSLFHFRPVDYFVNNPLFAIMMIPAIIGQELLGLKSQ